MDKVDIRLILKKVSAIKVSGSIFFALFEVYSSLKFGKFSLFDDSINTLYSESTSLLTTIGPQ